MIPSQCNQTAKVVQNQAKRLLDLGRDSKAGIQKALASIRSRGGGVSETIWMLENWLASGFLNFAYMSDEQALRIMNKTDIPAGYCKLCGGCSWK